ncbi:MAG TPA: ABC transporter ATP-binding protein [Armatimonadota bacterium]|jgi:ABC-2 type transport system ATP-binding protein
MEDTRIITEERETAGAAVASVRDLRKRYKEVEAVRGLSFDLRRGEIFGLLGPNGAGKTTTIEIMEGLRAYDAGSVSVLGLDPWRQTQDLKQRIGAALQDTMLPDKIKVGEALSLYAGFYDRRVDLSALMARFDLKAKRNATYETLSGGQKQRLALALTLVNDPDLVFLDEPTAGLDAQVRRDLHEIILQLRADGKTVLLTTHYIEEAERLCDRVAIIAQGELKAIGTPEELRSRASSLARIGVRIVPGVGEDVLRSLPTVADVTLRDDIAWLSTRRPAETVAALVRMLDNRESSLESISIIQPTLEDLYLELTGAEEAAP